MLSSTSWVCLALTCRIAYINRIATPTEFLDVLKFVMNKNMSLDIKRAKVENFLQVSASGDNAFSFKSLLLLYLEQPWRHRKLLVPAYPRFQTTAKRFEPLESRLGPRSPKAWRQTCGWLPLPHAHERSGRPCGYYGDFSRKVSKSDTNTSQAYYIFNG